MQLMTFNSLLMFDIVFVFFLFLVGVTCLVYYLPPSQHAIANYSRHSCKFIGDDEPETNSRGFKSKSISTAAVVADATATTTTTFADATAFEYQIETDPGCASNNSNSQICNRQRRQQQQQQQQNHQQQKQYHPQIQLQKQQLTHKHHHQHWELCKNMDQTKLHYSMLSECKTNKNFHHPTDDMNAMQDVDIQLSVTNEKYDPNGLPMQRTQQELRSNPPSFCYIKAKYREIKHINGPIQSV